MSDNQDTTSEEARKAKHAAYMRAYTARHREELNAAQKARYAANREQRKAKVRAYAAANKDKITAASKAYYAANKEALSAKSKLYNEANKDKLRAKAKARYEANKERAIERAKAYAEANPGKVFAYKRDWDRRAKCRKYGLTLDEFHAMLDECGGRCPCCKTSFSSLLGEQPVIDHCHKIGRVREAVRGILCHRCNMLLGHANDNPKVLRACARYLERFAK